MIEDATNGLSGWANERLSRRDVLLLAGFCLVLFGFTMIDGRPLSLHSARLPEIAREMMRSHDWLVPRSGGRPWLERPPLPHWIAIALSTVLGQHCDSVWVVRLPSVLAGTGTVLLTAWIGAVGMGRVIGLLSAYALATAFEFYSYSGLSEEDIYLAVMVAATIALFIRIEGQPIRSINPIGPRPLSMLLMFALMGLMNVVKSPFVGMAAACPVIAVYLLWNCFLAPSPGIPGEGAKRRNISLRVDLGNSCLSAVDGDLAVSDLPAISGDVRQLVLRL